jgi:hypothetical protein
MVNVPSGPVATPREDPLIVTVTPGIGD